MVLPPSAAMLVVAFAATTPAPARDAALAEMVAAERAFSARAAVVGVRDSFLEFFAPDCVFFNPGMSLAVPALQARSASAGAPRKAALQWQPLYADMSASADLGWETGPVVVRELAGEKKETPQGYFFSIWRRQSDGTLKVELDAGLDVTHAEEPFVAVAAGPSPPAPTASESAKAGLQARDRELLAAIAARGQRAGYDTFLAENVRLHRDGEPPIGGRAAALAWFGSHETTIQGEAVATGVSRAGDLGYVVSKLAVTRGAEVSEAWAVRMWRWSPQGWKVVFDTLLPAPPPPPPPASAPPAPPKP